MTFETNPTCPYCGHEVDSSNHDLWEYGGEDNDFECPNCEKELVLNVQVTTEYELKRPECSRGEQNAVVANTNMMSGYVWTLTKKHLIDGAKTRQWGNTMPKVNWLKLWTWVAISLGCVGFWAGVIHFVWRYYVS